SLSTLVDSFNDGVLGPEWGNSYGGTTEAGGRAVVPCTTGYAGCQTGYAWTLAGASFFVQVPTTPDPAGATAEAYAAVTVQGTVEGTRVGFIINKFSGLLRCVSETRSEEHTSELQSRENLVCRLLLEKKNNKCHRKRRG